MLWMDKTVETNYSSLKSRNILFTAMTRSKAWVRVTGYGEAMESLCSEYKQIKDNDFKTAICISQQRT